MRALTSVKYNTVTNWNSDKANDIHAMNYNAYHYMLFPDGSIWRGEQVSKEINSEKGVIKCLVVLDSKTPLVTQRHVRSLERLSKTVKSEFCGDLLPSDFKIEYSNNLEELLMKLN